MVSIGCSTEDYTAYLEGLSATIGAWKLGDFDIFFIVLPDVFGLDIRNPSKYPNFRCDDEESYHIQVKYRIYGR